MPTSGSQKVHAMGSRISVTTEQRYHLLRRCLAVDHLRQRAHLPEEDVQSNAQTDNSPGQQCQQRWKLRRRTIRFPGLRWLWKCMFSSTADNQRDDNGDAKAENGAIEVCIHLAPITEHAR